LSELKALAALKRLPEAKKACRRPVKLDPLFHGAFNSLGVTCQQLGHLDEAVKHQREAVRLRRSHRARDVLSRPRTRRSRSGAMGLW
jgi:tetratricopeptide (TPR) repeat protein